jgi:tetratricopeptide (TPR) repeat protein
LGYTLTERTTRYQEAYDLLKQALDLQPEAPYVLDSMGWVLYKMGKYQEAIKHLRKAQANADISVLATFFVDGMVGKMPCQSRIPIQFSERHFAHPTRLNRLRVLKSYDGSVTAKNVF